LRVQNLLPPKKDDPEDLSENKRPSSPSIGFEPPSAGPASVFHDDSLETENSWAMEFYEELTLESEEKDSLRKHGNFILEAPQEPCSHSAFLESASLCAVSTHKDYNNPKVLHCKMFKWMAIDAFFIISIANFVGTLQH
jgi:hypothetical protein